MLIIFDAVGCTPVRISDLQRHTAKAFTVHFLVTGVN